jgi:hypothetical protein
METTFTGGHQRGSGTRIRIATRLLLLAGFGAYLAGLWAGHQSPATGYELSIYVHTPTVFWAGIGTAVAVSLLVALFGPRGTSVSTALVLGGLSMGTIVALPVLRGYHYQGSGDALTHLGWTQEFATATRGVTSVIYPAGHLSGAAITRLTDLPARRALMMVVIVLTLLYFLFVPLVIRLLDFGGRASVLGAFSGFMLLPVTNVSTHQQFHPYTLTLYLFPFVIYLLVRYVTRFGEDDPTVGGMTPTGILLGIALVTLVLSHPQTALNVFILCVTIAAIQAVHSRRMPDEISDRTRSVLGITVFFGVVLFLWVLPFGKFYSLFFGVLESTSEAIQGEEAVGQNVQQREGSLRDIGVGLPTIFVRMFLVQTVYVGLTALVFGAHLFGGIRDASPEAGTVVSYLTVGGIALMPFFLLHFVGDVSGYFFRHVGFGMAIATLVGPLCLASVLRMSSRHRGRYLVRASLCTAMAGLLVLSVLALFASPFIFKANQHVTEAQLSGHEEAFETAADDVPFTGIRSGPHRRIDAVGPSEGVTAAGGVPPRVVAAGNMTEFYDGPIYLIVTRMSVQREVRAYDELRYSADMFRSLSGREGVNLVRSNGHVTVYYVGANGTETG